MHENEQEYAHGKDDQNDLRPVRDGVHRLVRDRGNELFCRSAVRNADSVALFRYSLVYVKMVLTLGVFFLSSFFSEFFK